MSFANKIDMLYDATLALVYPYACAACGVRSVEARADLPACAACWRATHIFSGNETMCWKCGALARGASGALEREKREDVRCRRCDDESWTAARACGVYEGALRAAVLTLKHEPHVSARLARLLLETQRRPPLDAATRIVPVPLHPRRERERGFNQAATLGRALAAQTRLPFDEWSLVRTVYAERHRAGMDARARRETVADAFDVRRTRLIEGERVLVIDDVFTTGATVSACARALRVAGASEVFVLTVARA
ncbi:MAG TPA: ComF family protein [Pyrinomonadaceae bacterium]|jgi:ComF family protein